MVNIVNPETGRNVSLYGKTGQTILYNYLKNYDLSGGGNGKYEKCKSGLFKNETKVKGKKIDCSKHTTKAKCDKDAPNCSFYKTPPSKWDSKSSDLGAWSKCATSLHNSCQTGNLNHYLELKNKAKLQVDREKMAKEKAKLDADKAKQLAAKAKAKAASDKLHALAAAKKAKEKAIKDQLAKCKGSCSPSVICPLAGYRK